MDDVMDKPTTTPISTRKHGDVLIILSNNPPVNALGSAVRKGLVDAIEQAEIAAHEPGQDEAPLREALRQPPGHQ